MSAATAKTPDRPQPSHQALYRKYRSKSLDTVVGQEHITDTLKHALKTGKLAHAYLFTGPRGVGKTSVARILAHEINGLPYEDESAHLDIIEIDAASNRRIDEIRELRDKVNTAPSSAKYKVYIIDEVHMLTREAFNALLKTLEEPPAHVVFILATTESHKLPETIVSRTQRFLFRPVEQAKVVAHLRSIAEAEAIDISDEALELVAAHGEGSFRDSISLLDQSRGHDGKVGDEVVRRLIGLPTDEAVTAVLDGLARHDAGATARSIADLRLQGFAAPQTAKRLGQRLRADILQGVIPAGVFELLDKLLRVPAAQDPETYLELALLEHALAGQTTPPPAATTTLPAAAVTPPPAKTAASHQPTAPKQASPQPVSAAPAAKAELSFAPPPVKPSSVKKAATAPAESKPLDIATWPQVLEALKSTHNTLYGIIRMARPDFTADGLDLYCKFPFHQKRVNEAKNRDIILEAIRSRTGQEPVFRCLVEAKDAPAAPAAPAFVAAPAAAPGRTAPAGAGGPASDPAIMATVNDIFGGGEVLPG